MYVAVSLGTVPGDGALKGFLMFSEKDGAEKKKIGKSSPQHKDDEPTMAKVAQQATTLMSLLNANAEWNTPSKTSRVWLGEEVEEPAWRLYDEAYWEKMASTGNRA